MCRFVAYHGPEICLADLITRPKHSIIHQSHHAEERSEPLNGDGFGVAWYAADDPSPAVFKDVMPAWNNRNLINVARVVSSRAIVAHVRAATQGLSVMRGNCHPFAYRGFAFMHNGNVGDFRSVRRAILNQLSDEAFAAVKGTTDSEHAFGLWIDHWLAADAMPALVRMKHAMQQTLASLKTLAATTEPSTLNLAVTDGSRFVASRVVFGDDVGNTLYWRKGNGLRCEAGVCTMDTQTDAAVLVASEPLFDHDTWQVVPMNALLTVDEHADVLITPLG